MGNISKFLQHKPSKLSINQVLFWQIVESLNDENFLDAFCFLISLLKARKLFCVLQIVPHCSSYAENEKISLRDQV